MTNDMDLDFAVKSLSRDTSHKIWRFVTDSTRDAIVSGELNSEQLKHAVRLFEVCISVEASINAAIRQSVEPNWNVVFSRIEFAMYSKPV